MKIELYIGTTLLDFDEQINVNFSIGDIRDISLGNLNKSYTINVPLTDTNKAALKHSHTPGSTDEVTSTGRLFVDGLQIICGAVKVLGFTEEHAKIIITADDWIDDILNTDLVDIDFTDEDHILTEDNIEDSWTASDAFYRYPMINFGQLVTPATGSQPHDWAFNDFIPMFRIIDLLEYIFAPWIIVSDWFDTTYAKKLYMLGEERKIDSDFIDNKDLDVRVLTDNDNYVQENYSASETRTITLTQNVVEFNSVASNEGTNYNTTTDVYTVPEDGTYRFLVKLNGDYISGIGSFSCILSSFEVDITLNGAVLSIANGSASDIGGDGAFTSVEVDSGYRHLTAGDTIQVKAVLTGRFTNGGSADWMRLFLTAGATVSYLKTDWSEWNRYPGRTKTITASDYMPDVKCIDFVKAVKQLANLRFFVDRSNHKIYIEPAQSFFVTDEEVDLTDLQDYEELSFETISQNYNKSIVLGFQEDTKDKAYIDYIDYNEVPAQKTIELSSVYAEAGEQEMINNLFAHSVAGYFREIGAYGVDVLRIYGDQEYIEDSSYPAYRAVGFKPRLVTWEGLTSGIAFDFNSSNYTTYPKVLPVDFADLYTNYWLTTIHQIDKNMIVTVRVKMPQSVINQLTMVLSDASAEGFRPKYKLKIRGQYVYGYLNNLVTDGDISECEFIIKN